MNADKRVDAVMCMIKATVPLDPKKELSHSDAFEDSEAREILLALVNGLLDELYSEV